MTLVGSSPVQPKPNESEYNQENPTGMESLLPKAFDTASYQGGLHIVEVTFLLLTQQSLVRFSAFRQIYFDVTKIY